MGWSEPRMVAASPQAVEARIACCTYLDERIQDEAEQMPGRKPDFSSEASKAFKALLKEVATRNSTPALARRLTATDGPLGGLPTMTLASQLEKMALQLKVSGEATPSQLADVRAQLDVLGSKQRGEEIQKDGVMPAVPKSSACLIM